MKTHLYSLKLFLFVLLASFSVKGWGQTNPQAQSLPYAQNFSTFTGSTTTYPIGWQGWDISGSLGTTYATSAPSANRNLTSATNTNGSSAGVFDIVGKLGILSTGSAIKSVVLAINTSGNSNISLKFKAGTQYSQGRINMLGVQYRVGTSGGFTDLNNSSYQNSGSSQNTGTNAIDVQSFSIVLPTELENKPTVQLRWIIKDTPSQTGNRTSFSIDDIEVSGNIGKTVTFNKNATTATGTMANQTAAPNTALKANTFSRPGYSFSNWTENAAGGGTTYADQATYPFAADATLYAQWQQAGITVSNNGTQVGATNLTQGNVNNVISKFKVDVASADVNLKNFMINAHGSYLKTDIPTFKLWRTTGSSFTGQTLVGSMVSIANGSGEALLFSNVNNSILKGTTAYYWITADVASNATIGKTVNVGALNASDAYLEFDESAISFTGTASAAGVQTIVANTNPYFLIENKNSLAFGDTCVNETSANVGSFDFFGFNLTSNVTIGALNGYTFSKDANVFSTSLTLQPDATGAISEHITIKFTPTSATAFNGDVPIVGGGATATSVAVTGAGIAGTVSVTSVAHTNLTSTSATSGGKTISTSCGAITAKGVVWGTSSNPTIALSTKTNDGTGTSDFVSNITGLSPNTTYYYRAYATNSNGITSYGTSSSFTTPCGSVNIPYIEDFEGVNVPSLPSCTSVINAGSGNVWKTSTPNSDGFNTKTLTYEYKLSVPANTWFFTKGLNLTAGTTYRLRYKYGNVGAYSEKMKVAYGMNNNVAAMTTVLMDYPNINQSIPQNENVTFTPTATGVYYIGFQAYSDSTSDSGFYLYVDDINVDVAPSAIHIKDSSNKNVTTIAFGNQQVGVASASQTFYVSGDVLENAPGQITITAPANFEISTDNVSFNSSVNFQYSSPSLSSTAFYLRFKPQTGCTTLSNQLTITGGASEIPVVMLTGQGIVGTTIAHTAPTITGTGFTATWDAVPNATSYKVNVYKKSIGTPKHEIENFDGVVPSGNYAGAGSTYNAGWDFSSTGSRQIYTSANNFGANAPSYAFTVTGDYIKTRLFSNEILKVSFWAKQQSGTTSSTLLEGFNGTSWVTLATLNNNNPIISTTTGGTVTYDLVNLGFNKIYQIRLVFTKAAGNLSIDDISIEYENKILTPVTGSPFTVPAPATSYVVNGLESDTDYFYTVTALVDNCSSLESNEIAVTTTDKVIWKDAKWNNEIGPNENVNAEIASVYDQQADIEVKNLNVIATGSLNIQANHSVTVHGVLSQAADNQITVESDASLVQAVGSTHDGKSIIVKRNATVPSAQYNIWSSPVKAQKLYDLYGTPGSVPAGTVMEYITKSDIFKPIVNPNVTSDFAKGYSAKGLADNASGAVTAIFKGEPNNGEVSIGLSVDGKRFNAVGNPYPSNLDLNKLYDDNTSILDSSFKNITNLVRFWDNTNNEDFWQQGSNYSGNNYAIYNLDAGVGVPGTHNGNNLAKIPDGIVKPGQGFMVRANTSGDQVLKFNNGQRLASAHADTPYYKNSSNKDRFWLALETPGAIVNTIAIAYNDLATNNNDIYDTSILDANNSDLFYSLSDNQYKQAIQSRKGGFADTDAVKLGAKYYKAGTHKIKVIKKDGVFEGGQNIYLHDKVLNKYIDLTTEAYSFDASASSNDTRFEIVYKPGAVLGAVDAQSKDAVVVYKTSDAFVVLSKADAITKVELYDMNGRLIQVNDKVAKEQKLSHETLSNGAYLLKISRGQNVVVKKVLK